MYVDIIYVAQTAYINMFIRRMIAMGRWPIQMVFVTIAMSKWPTPFFEKAIRKRLLKMVIRNNSEILMRNRSMPN